MDSHHYEHPCLVRDSNPVAIDKATRTLTTQPQVSLPQLVNGVTDSGKYISISLNTINSKCGQMTKISEIEKEFDITRYRAKTLRHISELKFTIEEYITSKEKYI